MARTLARRGISLQERIYRVLQERIGSGDYPPGAALPAEDALAASFAVSRVTIRAALARLEQDGRIRRIQGRGTLVTGWSGGTVRLLLTDVLSDMDHVARATSVSVVEFAYRPAPLEVAAMLLLPPEEVCQHAIRLRSAEGKILLHLTTWIPEAIGRLWTREDLAGSPLQSLFTRHGIVPVAGHQVVSASLAAPAVAGRLAVEIGAALLRVQRVNLDRNERPIEYIEILGPASSFELRMSLRMPLDDVAGVS